MEDRVRDMTDFPQQKRARALTSTALWTNLLTWECHTPFQHCSPNQGEQIGAGFARSGPSRQPPLPIKHPKQGQVEGVRGAMIKKQEIWRELEEKRPKQELLGSSKIFSWIFENQSKSGSKAVCPAQNQNPTFGRWNYSSVISWGRSRIFFKWLEVAQKYFCSDLRLLKRKITQTP